ncbi:hypothetical protein QFZ78_000177 [Paenibacillus sp. V4I5]|nr:hypothetical protein [Paenibacillus sp. V4I5]
MWSNRLNTNLFVTTQLQGDFFVVEYVSLCYLMLYNDKLDGGSHS